MRSDGGIQKRESKRGFGGSSGRSRVGARRGNKIVRNLGRAVWVVLLVLLLGACGPTGKETTTNAGGKPVRGGIWTDDFINEPDSFIPNGSTSTFAWMAMQALWAPLFAGTPQGAIQPGIATELPTLANKGVNADASVWTFHLRRGVKWSDGAPLTAEDVDFTWKLWQNPQFAAANISVIRHIERAEVSADGRSITFHLDQPLATFLTGWTDGLFAPLPGHVFARMDPGAIKKSSANLNPRVVSGPFTMQQSVPGDHYTLVRNPQYYQGAQGLPYLDKVVFRPVGDQTTILKDLQSGAIDSAWFLDSSQIGAYRKLSNYQLILGTSAGYEALEFNLKNKALADVQVRQAIARAVDQQSLISTARQGAGTALCTDHSAAYHPGYQQTQSCPRFDLAAARRTLDQAGWKVGSDGVREKNGERLEFQYSTTSGNQWRAADETINQANLASIGIKVDITNYPASTFFSSFLGSRKAGQFDIAEWERSYTYDADDVADFGCGQPGNFNSYCNPQLDALFKAEEAIPPAEVDKRQEIFNQIHAILLRDLPMVTLYSPDDISMVAKGAHNYSPGPFGASETVNIWQWCCDGGTCPA